MYKTLNDCLKGIPCLLVFFPRARKEDGDATLDLLNDLALAPELNIQLIAVTTESTNSLTSWLDEREGGAAAPILFIPDRAGEVCRAYGVLDVKNNRPYHSVFIIDEEGVVQGVQTSAEGGLQPSTASDMLDFIRNALAKE